MERLAASGVDVVGRLVPDVEATITTLASVWLIDDDAYLRLPKNEHPNDGDRSHESAWGRLDDGRRLPYRDAAWTVEADGAIHVRIHPTAGPDNGYGIITGPVTTATGLAATDPLRNLAPRSHPTARQARPPPHDHADASGDGTVLWAAGDRRADLRPRLDTHRTVPVVTLNRAATILDRVRQRTAGVPLQGGPSLSVGRPSGPAHPTAPVPTRQRTRSTAMSPFTHHPHPDPGLQPDTGDVIVDVIHAAELGLLQSAGDVDYIRHLAARRDLEWRSVWEESFIARIRTGLRQPTSPRFLRRIPTVAVYEFLVRDYLRAVAAGDVESLLFNNEYWPDWRERWL